MIGCLLGTICLVISIYNGAATPRINENRYQANLNTIVDEITTKIGLYGGEIGLEPLKIPDIHHEKEKDGSKLVFNLTQGILSNVISIKRHRNVEASYDSGILNVKAGIRFTDLESGFSFVVNSWGLNPVGYMRAKIPDLAVFVETRIDAFNLNGTLDKVSIPSVGDIDISIKTTKPIYGMTMTFLTEMFTLFFQDELVYILGKVIRSKLNKLLIDIQDSEILPKH